MITCQVFLRSCKPQREKVMTTSKRYLTVLNYSEPLSRPRGVVLRPDELASLGVAANQRHAGAFSGSQFFGSPL
jgi:hypothetical protein